MILPVFQFPSSGYVDLIYIGYIDNLGMLTLFSYPNYILYLSIYITPRVAVESLLKVFVVRWGVDAAF